MNTREIIAEADKANLRLCIEGQNLRVRGIGARPDWLLRAIRSHRDEIIALLSEERESSERSSEQCLPAREVPLLDEMPVLAEEERDSMINLVMQQGKPAIGWCMLRACQYFETFPGSEFKDQDAVAARDLVEWQRTRTMPVSSVNPAWNSGD